jgi:hypothetical protein
MNQWFWNAPGIVIPIVAILMPVAIVGISLYFRNREREMIHRERLLAMEKGLQPPVDAAPVAFGRHEHGHRERGQRDYLLRGLILLFIGLGAFGFMFVSPELWGGHMNPHMRDSFFALPFLAIIPGAVGLAYLVAYAIESQKQPPRPPVP